MTIDEIMLRDMADAKKQAEEEQAEREARAIRRADRLVNVGCALLTVLAFAAGLFLAACLFWDRLHKRWDFGTEKHQNQEQQQTITNATLTIGDPLTKGAYGHPGWGDKKLTFTNGVLHAVTE